MDEDFNTFREARVLQGRGACDITDHQGRKASCIAGDLCGLGDFRDKGV